MKIRDFDVPYVIDTNGQKSLCYSIPSYRYFLTNGVNSSTNGVKVSSTTTKKNDVFQESMKIEYRKDRSVRLRSLYDNTLYHIFQSEYIRVIQECIILKGEIHNHKWAIRNHGGLLSLMLVG